MNRLDVRGKAEKMYKQAVRMFYFKPTAKQKRDAEMYYMKEDGGR